MTPSIWTLAIYARCTHYFLWLLPLHDPHTTLYNTISLLHLLTPIQTDQRWWLN